MSPVWWLSNTAFCLKEKTTDCPSFTWQSGVEEEYRWYIGKLQWKWSRKSCSFFCPLSVVNDTEGASGVSIVNIVHVRSINCVSSEATLFIFCLMAVVTVFIIALGSSPDLGWVLVFVSLHYNACEKMVFACPCLCPCPCPWPRSPCLLQTNDVANTFCGYKVLSKEVRWLNAGKSAST